MKLTPVARARGITKTFGNIIALDSIDFDVEAGQVVGVVGPNGAGKTTLLGLLLGLATADAGSLEVLGVRRARGVPMPDGVAGFVDGPGLYPALTARQNLAALAALRRSDRSRDVAETLAQVGLTDVADDRVRGFSLGMRQRLGLAAALITHPRLLVLDEPANGLDPAGKQHVHRVIRDLAKDGVGIVLSSHRMDDIAELCSEVTLLAAGRVVFSGSLAKMAAESGELDYRLVTSDPGRAVHLASANPSLRVIDASERLVVRGSVPGLDDLVVRLVGAGIAVRELSPVVSPLEAAYLELTASGTDAGEGA